MASPAKGELNLDDLDDAECWIVAFEAKAKIKMNKKKLDKTQMADLFLSSCGSQALKRVRTLLLPSPIGKATYEDISKAIKTHLQPKQRLTIAERTKFLSETQLEGETDTQFHLRLKGALRFCHFDELKTCKDPEEEMLKLKFISGLRNKETKYKVLEFLRGDAARDSMEVLEFCKTLQQEREFVFENNVKNSAETGDTNAVMSQSGYCGQCGGTHKPRQCPAFGKFCAKCHGKNHYARTCKVPQRQLFTPHRTPSAKVNMVDPLPQDKSTEDNQPVGVWCLEDTQEINMVQPTTTILHLPALNKTISMMVDTGATRSVISSRMWKKLNSPKLIPHHSKLIAYDGHQMTCLGTLKTSLSSVYHNKEAELVVIKSEKEYGLLGRDLLTDTTAIHAASTPEEILPTIKGIQATIRLKPGAKPTFCPARKVPLPLRESVVAELGRLERMGIITPCRPGGTENASPVVWVKKKDGSLRMCADYKAHLNNNICTETYPLPHFEEIFAGMGEARFFAKIDLKSAYWQILLDEESQELSTINTSLGLYRVLRLQMGMKNSAAIFQRTMEQVLDGLNGVVCYQDDLLVHAETQEQLKDRLRALKERLHERGFTVNVEKSTEMATSLEFLGFLITEKGIQPSDEHVAKLRKMQPPKNSAELETAVGLFNFFGRMIPQYAEKVRVLNELRTQKPKFDWKSDHQRAFEQILSDLTSPPVLKPYSLNKEATLTTDASGHQIGACLTQEGNPVIFISRKLTKAEMNYSNIEREALALVWGVQRLRHLLLGRQFTLVTDHKPLEVLFGQNHALPKTASARITRWAISIMAFDYQITYKSGVMIPHADALSRLTIFEDPESKEGTVFYTVDDFGQSPLSMDRLTADLNLDKVALGVIRRIITGRWSGCSSAEKVFKREWKALTVNNGHIYHGTRMYIPPNARKDCFQRAHDVHQGINATVNKLEKESWWPGLNRDVAKWVEECAECAKARPRSTNDNHTWPPASPWERLHADWAYVREHGEILVIVDAATNWIEAYPCKSRDVGEIKAALRDCFSRFGIPVTLVTDNAKEFAAEALNSWLKTLGCGRIFTPLYNPASNGQAERAVQTVKFALKTWKPEMKTSVKAYLAQVLMNHRNTASSHGKESPAQALIHRSLRLPILASYRMGENIWMSSPIMKPSPTPVEYILPAGANTSWINKNGHTVLAANRQLSSMGRGEGEPENGGDVAIPPQNHATGQGRAPSSPPNRVLRNRNLIFRPTRYLPSR
jgi:hypothetical protein